jgi:RNA polymerase sigma-70 factor (ECF subfamily)
MSIMLCCSPVGSGGLLALGGWTPPARSDRGMNTLDATDAETPEARERRDALLLTQIAAGDRDAFALLYDRFSAPLYSTALQVLRDTTEAQDVVHDAFVTLWEKAATFETTRGSAFSWAVTLVRNRAIDRVRMRRRRAELLAESVPEDLGYASEGSSLDASDAAILGENARLVRAAVAALPPDQQRALELAFFSGLTQEEISRQLREPLGTVKARIRRGLLKLRDLLAPQR